MILTLIPSHNTNQFTGCNNNNFVVLILFFLDIKEWETKPPATSYD